MAIWVIDAGFAIKWFTPEPPHDAARALLDEADERMAPDWIQIEVANVLRKQARRGLTS
jgi:predicted nucleic acid-binding protein